jgi:hypothetical protein
LYQAAICVKEIAPWEWMSETDLFGVQNPETGEIGFVSVMGMLGEHYAVAVYLGPEGLYGFWRFQEMVPFDSPEDLLGIPQLQVSRRASLAPGPHGYGSANHVPQVSCLKGVKYQAHEIRQLHAGFCHL